MIALMSTIAAILFLAIAACGRTDGSTASSGVESASRGRLMCTAVSTEVPRMTLSGCTDGSMINVSKPEGRMTVVRRGATLDISVTDLRSGASWSGYGELRFPVGGTGTRSRLFIQQPGVADIACHQDSLLRCAGH